MTISCNRFSLISDDVRRKEEGEKPPPTGGVFFSISWPDLNAPYGSYTVEVHQYGSNGASVSNYEVTVRYGDEINEYSGYTSYDDEIDVITEFEYQ